MILAKEFEGELWIKAEHHHQAVKQAVEAEREWCAKLCEEEMVDEIEDETYYICKDLALRIRKREKA